jgi:TRAP-type mannitol/chloroaromatic compound transport system substrate-binding protein
MTARRSFIAKAGGAVAAAAVALVDAPNVIAQPKVQWRMSTTYPPVLDVLNGAAQRRATLIDEMSDGRFRIKVSPGGQTMPAFACFDAASQGTIEAFMSSPAYYYYPGWHEPGTTNEFSFNKKAYGALPVDLQRMLDHAAAATQVYSLTDYHVKNAIALERLKAEFKGKVEVVQLPAPVLRDLKKLAAEVVREESERSTMTRKVHTSFAKFQALVGPWDRVADGAYHQFVAG